MISTNGHYGGYQHQFRQALRLLHQGRAKEAIALLEPLHQQHPENIEIGLNLGGGYILEKQYAEAEAILTQITEEAPNNANAWVNLAAAHLGPLEESNHSQQEKAIAAYQKALTLQPDIANVHYMLGLIYRVRRDHLRAAAHFIRALEQNPNDNDARRLLASIPRK